MCRGSTVVRQVSAVSQRERMGIVPRLKHIKPTGQRTDRPTLRQNRAKRRATRADEYENVFLSLRPAAPLRSPPQQTNTRFAGDPGPTAVGSWSDTPLTQPLSLIGALRDSGTDWASLLPRLAALDSIRGWRFVAPGFIFERDTQARRKWIAVIAVIARDRRNRTSSETQNPPRRRGDAEKTRNTPQRARRIDDERKGTARAMPETGAS